MFARMIPAGTISRRERTYYMRLAPISSLLFSRFVAPPSVCVYIYTYTYV